MCNVQICLWVVLFLLRSTPPSCSCLKKRIARVRAGTERHKNRSRELKGGRYGKIGWNLSWNLIFSKYETLMTSRNVQAHGAKLKAHMRYVYISLYIIYIYITHDYTYIYILYVYVNSLTPICPDSNLLPFAPNHLKTWQFNGELTGESWTFPRTKGHCTPKMHPLQHCNV